MNLFYHKMYNNCKGNCKKKNTDIIYVDKKGFMKKKVSNNMYKKIKKSLIEYIISNRLFMSYVLISIISMVLVRKNTVGIFKSPFPFLTDLGIILVVGAIGYFIKPQKQYKYFFIWVCIFALIGLVNSIYYVFYTSFASFGELATLSQTETVTGSIWEKFRWNYLVFILLPLLFHLIHKKLSDSSYYNFLNCVEKDGLININRGNILFKY